MNKIFELTLRRKIFLALMALTVFSFLFTGLYSFFHFLEESEEYHEERLKRKEYSVSTNIGYFMSVFSIPYTADRIASFFDDKICELSEIQNQDIAFYDLKGNYLVGSQISRTDTAFLPSRLDPITVQELSTQTTRFTKKKKILKDDYLFDYFYLRNELGEPIMIILLPYYISSEFFDNEISSFLESLLKIYVLLFLVSGIAAYLLSRAISQPLSNLRQKMQASSLEKNYMEIEGDYPMEVKLLVDDYNRVVKELKQNAVKLARSERDSAWRDVARQVAHEIKNPLTPMRLQLQMMERSLKTEEPEKLKNYVSSLVEQIDSLTRLAETFSRFGSLPELKFEPFSLNDIVVKSINAIPDEGVSMELPDKEIIFEGDHLQLLRVLNNLIKNALQSVPSDKSAQVKVKLEELEDQYLITVSDNGTGIKTDDLERIFEPRFTTKSSGMGLGLAIVRAILQGHKGKIFAESTLGKGSTFYLYLPK